MLVLSRKRGEKIHIGGGIMVTVVELRGDRVRLGITAPDHVPIHRLEIWESILADEPFKAGDQPSTAEILDDLCDNRAPHPVVRS